MAKELGGCWLPLLETFERLEKENSDAWIPSGDNHGRLEGSDWQIHFLFASKRLMAESRAGKKGSVWKKNCGVFFYKDQKEMTIKED